LKLKYYKPLSTFAFNVISRPYNTEALRPIDPLLEGQTCLLGQEPSAHALLLVDKPRLICNAWMASAMVGRCRLNPCSLRLPSALECNI